MDVKTVEAGGQKIAYYESSGSGPAVMLIHGNSASSQTFKAQVMGEFGQKYRVVAMDLPGHGESDQAASRGKHTTCRGMRPLWPRWRKN